MIKGQQIVSGCFRTEDGAHIFCALPSYFSTARKHGLDAIDAIDNAFLDQPFILDTNQALKLHVKFISQEAFPASSVILIAVIVWSLVHTRRRQVS